MGDRAFPEADEPVPVVDALVAAILGTSEAMLFENLYRAYVTGPRLLVHPL